MLQSLVKISDMDTVDAQNPHRFMMNLNLTVVAGIVGLILADKADPHLLFVLPIASSAIGLVCQWYVVHS